VVKATLNSSLVLAASINATRVIFEKTTRYSTESAILACPSCAVEDKRTLAAARHCLVANKHPGTDTSRPSDGSVCFYLAGTQTALEQELRLERNARFLRQD
jgi:hypothetical protein